MTGHVFFPIGGLRVVAHDGHSIAESSVSVPGPPTRTMIPICILRLACPSLTADEEWLLLVAVRHIPFVGMVIPGRQDKRSDGIDCGGQRGILHKMTRGSTVADGNETDPVS